MLTCKNLTIGYKKQIVKKDINFVVQKNDFVVVIGDNGSGKTTLIKTILGLLPKIEGTIDKNYSNVGYLPQQSKIQNDFPATVNEIALSGNLNKMGFKPFYGKKEKEKTNHVLSLLNIESIKHDSFNQLSGGQKQKVLLARALLASNELLILDEPTSALSPVASKEFYDLLKVINKDTTIVLISHDINDSLQYANKVLIINDDIEYLNIEEYNERYK